MADLFSHSCTDILVIGVGALGCSVAGRGALNDACELPLQAEWAALHTHSSELFATGLERRLLMALPAGVLHEDVVDSALHARAENWLPWVQGKRLVLLAADENDAVAAALTSRLSQRIADTGTEVLVVLAAGTGCDVSFAVPLLRIGVELHVRDLRPSALEAARVARTLEGIEALIAALRAHSALGAKENLREFLRWGRLQAHCGCSREAGEIGRTLEALDLEAEAVFLLVHNASERSVAELERLHGALDSRGLNGPVSVVSAEGRAPEEGLFWLLLARRPRAGNIVALNAAPREVTSVACERI